MCRINHGSNFHRETNNTVKRSSNTLALALLGFLGASFLLGLFAFLTAIIALVK